MLWVKVVFVIILRESNFFSLLWMPKCTDVVVIPRIVYTYIFFFNNKFIIHRVENSEECVWLKTNSHVWLNDKEEKFYSAESGHFILRIKEC